VSRYYLVQRLSRPYASTPGRGFDSFFALDYMGSSEFEWGAIPTALCRMRAYHDLGVEPHSVLRRGEPHQVHLVGSRRLLRERADDLTLWLTDHRPRGKEASYFPERLDGDTSEWMMRTVAWWSIEDDVAWALDRDVAQDLYNAFTSRPSVTA
jgi:hypothetical protein